MDNCANLIPVRGEEGLENCTAEALKSRRGEFKDKNLCDLCGHEKKSKNHQNCKFCLNEIKYLQLLIFAKRDFFSRPVPLR